MEQLRHRLTNVSPQGQYCSADQNALKRSDLDDFVACLPWRDELGLVHDERLDRAMPYTSRLRSESLFSLMTAGRRSRIELFWKTLPNYSIYTSSGLTILRLNYRSTAICLYQLELGQPL